MNVATFTSTRLHRILMKLFLLMLVFSCIFSTFDSAHWKGIEPEDDVNAFERFMTRLYFTSSTMSTVGYGDIVPKTHICRNVVVALQFGMIVVCLF
jgi:hypothetical protein